MMSTRNSGFWHPSPVHMRWTPLLWTTTCRCHEVHITLEKQLVQYPSRHKAEIRLFKTAQLVIYITNLYWQIISTFYSVETQLWSKKANFIAWEEDRTTSLGCNFLCKRPHGADPLPLSACVHLSQTPPLHVDLMNGWPLTKEWHKMTK